MTHAESPPKTATGARNARAGRRFDVYDCEDAAETPPPAPNIACPIQTRLDHAIP